MEYLLFSSDSLKDASLIAFEQSELGRIQSKIPFEELAEQFEAYRRPRHKGGRPAHMDIKGGLGLMFLKHYLGLSDAMLIDRLNSDIFLQLFCFTRIKITQPIRDKDLVSRWRRFFGMHMAIQTIQGLLAKHWQTDMSDTNVLMDDATCYESDIKYPTDVKLLNDCCLWLYRQVLKAQRYYGLPKIRDDKYRKYQNRFASFQKKKRKGKAEEKRLRRSSLKHLDRLQQVLQCLLNQSPAYHEKLNKSHYQRLKIIRIIYMQQQYMLTNNVRRVPHRIVSLYKPFLRPIIRGKERKRYEFGAKVHMSQVDGLNFIEHLSFEAFHEGNRMWYSIAKHKKRFGKCSHYAGDQIYATNKNRRKAKHHGVQTSFKRKGRAAADEVQRQQMRTILSKRRATALEGSFGTEKQHYLAGQRVRARTKETEIAWIFFTIHTANVTRLVRRETKRQYPPPRAA